MPLPTCRAKHANVLFGPIRAERWDRAVTVTRPMFERLCTLDQRSFLFKPFRARLRKSRERP